MKFFLCLYCLSIVWSIALTSCGAKHYENTPPAEQNPIRLQAKADAESDAKDDVDVQAYFASGTGAAFAAAMCGLMTGFIADLTLGYEQDDLFYMTASMSAAGGFKPADSILYPSTESAT